MPGFIGLKLCKSGLGSMKHHFHTCIVHDRVKTLTLFRIFGKTLRSSPILSLTKQDLGEKWMQLLTKIEAYRNDATANVCDNQS